MPYANTPRDAVSAMITGDLENQLRHFHFKEFWNFEKKSWGRDALINTYRSLAGPKAPLEVLAQKLQKIMQ